MIKQHKRVTSNQANTGAKRSLDFWASIDGKKLAKVGLKEKEMDIVGPKKGVKQARIG